MIILNLSHFVKIIHHYMDVYTDRTANIDMKIMDVNHRIVIKFFESCPRQNTIQPVIQLIIKKMKINLCNIVRRYIQKYWMIINISCTNIYIKVIYMRYVENKLDFDLKNECSISHCDIFSRHFTTISKSGSILIHRFLLI